MKITKEEKQQNIIAELRKELRVSKQKIRDLEQSKNKLKEKSKNLKQELSTEKKKSLRKS